MLDRHPERVRDFAEIDRFTVLLLDMNDTFLFGGDRFGTAHDYASTYSSLGGSLSADFVGKVVQDCFDYLLALYPDPVYHDAFPAVQDALFHCWGETDPLSEEIDLLERTFALHELGQVPEQYARAIRHLAETHRLGLVADIWSVKGLWLEELKRAGVLELFEVLVFSSDYGRVKPSPCLFQTAMQQMGVRPDECVVIGDSARRDMGGARAAGIAGVWIGIGAPPPGADWVVSDLLDLVERSSR